MTFETAQAFRLDAAELQRRRPRPLQAADPHSEADRIITQAKREADRMTSEAAARQERLDRYLAELTEEQISRFVDETQIRSSAEAAHAVLAESARLRAEFEALGPWLEELLVTCLQRIAGEVGTPRMIAGILSKAMAEMRTRDGLVLNVAPADTVMLAKAAETFPEVFASVETIVETPTLTPGEIELAGPGGVLQLGLRCQLAALVQRLREPPDGADAGSGA